MTEEQRIKSLEIALETKKLLISEKDMENQRLKKEIHDKEKIINGYQRFIRDNLDNLPRKSGGLGIKDE